MGKVTRTLKNIYTEELKYRDLAIVQWREGIYNSTPLNTQQLTGTQALIQNTQPSIHLILTAVYSLALMFLHLHISKDQNSATILIMYMCFPVRYWVLTDGVSCKDASLCDV